MKFLNWTLAVNITANIVLIVITEVELFKESKKDINNVLSAQERINAYEKIACNKPIWMINEILLFV